MHKVSTKCKDCIFAQYDGDSFQEGCSLGRIEKFHEKGVQLLQTEEDGKTFYTIDGRMCYYCRNSDWEDIYKKHRGADFNRLEEIRKELKFQYNAIILSNDNLNDVLHTYSNMLAQGIRPKHITILKYQDDKVNDKKFIKNFRKHSFTSWKLESLTLDRAEGDFPRDTQLVFNFHRYPYTLVIEAGKTLETNAFNKVDNQIAEDMITFGVIVGDGVTLVSRTVMDYLHVYYNGVEPELREKKCPQLILTF